MRKDDKLVDRKLTVVSTTSLEGVPSQAPSSSYSAKKEEAANVDDNLLISENMGNNFDSVEILKDQKPFDPLKSERLDNNGLMQMIDEDSREIESSFRSQTSLMPDMYLDGANKLGDN